MDRRGKEISPAETIENAKKIIDELGLTYDLLKIESNVGTYSHYLDVKFNEIPEYLVMHSNGKGVTEEYSEASAFAEMIERISNMAMLLNIERVKFKPYKGKYVSSGEKILDYKEAIELDGYIKKCKENYGKKFLKSYSDMESGFIDKDKNICIPVTNIADEKTYYIPFSHLAYDTNGMCAGNTKEEALCQGIFELFERFSHNYILEHKINTPILPKEIYEGTKSEEIIKEIEEYENKRFKIVVKECSLNLGVPIVCVILFDKVEKRYRTSFGSSYSYEIALERCLTELVQNREINNIDTVEISNMISSNSVKNMIEMSATGISYYPEEFLCNTKTAYDFKGDTVLGKDSKEIFENIRKILTNNKIDIYYFDNSFLGLNCYKLMSLELAYIKLIDVGNYYSHNIKIYDDISSDKLTYELAESKLDILLNSDIYYGSVGDIIGIHNSIEVGHKNIEFLVDLLTAVCALKVGDTDNFMYYLEKFLLRYNGKNFKGFSLLSCLKHLCIYSMRDVDLETTIGTLENVYTAEEIKECLDMIGDYDKIIKKFGFFDRNDSGIFNLHNHKFYERYMEFIHDVNRKRIESGK